MKRVGRRRHTWHDASRPKPLHKNVMHFGRGRGRKGEACPKQLFLQYYHAEQPGGRASDLPDAGEERWWADGGQTLSRYGPSELTPPSKLHGL